MKNTRKVIIVALACLNIGLLGALVHFNMTPAYAQPFRSTNYLVVTTKVSPTSDALCIIDLDKKKLAAWRWDKGKKRLLPIDSRDLPRDFQVRPARAGRRK